MQGRGLRGASEGGSAGPQGINTLQGDSQKHTHTHTHTHTQACSNTHIHMIYSLKTAHFKTFVLLISEGTFNMRSKRFHDLHGQRETCDLLCFKTQFISCSFIILFLYFFPLLAVMSLQMCKVSKNVFKGQKAVYSLVPVCGIRCDPQKEACMTSC